MINDQPKYQVLEQNHSSFKVIDQIYEDEENDLEED